MTSIELTAGNMAAGGEVVARDGSGRVVFVTGALPGERVVVDLTDERPRFARGVVTEVLTSSTERRTPPCPHVARGCGGCGWQHIEPAAQRRLKAEVVVEALQRIGGIEAPAVDIGPTLGAEGFRTTLRCSVVDGRAGFRRARGHEVVAVDHCLVAHPLADEVIAEGWFGSAHQVTVRVGARTGDRLVVVDPSAEDVRVPSDVLVVGADELARGRHAWYHEEVADRRWRVSATSFFQIRPDGAEALVRTVADAVAELAPDARHLVDLCCGVGLFAGTVDGPSRITAVERHRPAVIDARHNLAGHGARVIRASLASWRPSKADVVVVDPARAGLGPGGVAALAGTGAEAAVLVSCDPAALGRDAGLLRDAGYALVGITLVDLFPQTPHVEAVCRFAAGGAG